MNPLFFHTLSFVSFYASACQEPTGLANVDRLSLDNCLCYPSAHLSDRPNAV